MHIELLNVVILLLKFSDKVFITQKPLSEL